MEVKLAVEKLDEVLVNKKVIEKLSVFDAENKLGVYPNDLHCGLLVGVYAEQSGDVLAYVMFYVEVGEVILMFLISENDEMECG